MLENDYTLFAEDRRYTVIEQLGRGANTIAYLAECSHGELVTKCILKEYAPHNTDDFEVGKARFIAAGKMQNAIRQKSVLNNQTPPVSHVFEANGTAFIAVACYNGTTLDKLDLTLPQYMAICETIAKTVGYYHKSGYLCLDLKPENIFILQNAPDDTVAQLVEFIDFDSIRDVNNGCNALFSYTRDWAAPEQLNPYASVRISTAADIYTVGEIVFYLLFGRHSNDTEHRGFSRFPFEECKREYHKYSERPDIQALFARLFRNTIRSSAVNRFKNIDEVTKLLGELVEVLNQKDYIIPILPSVSPDFVGRDAEIRQIVESLQKNQVLYITGVGGIGKTTLVKNYISRFRAEYDVIAYLEYDGDLLHTFCDDMQLQISTVSRQNGEPIEEFFTRKLKAFKRICGDKHVLFVLDNYTDRLTKDLSRIINCGYDTIISTRNKPPKNSFAVLEVGAISDTADIFRLITLNLERQLTKAERQCFDEIITLIQGHTLVLELIARQIAVGRLDVHTALDLIRENGFSQFSDEKVGNIKDGEEVYDTLADIIYVLFDASAVSKDARLTLKILALLNVKGLETSLIYKFFPNIKAETIADLSVQGWLHEDNRVRLHPVIAETVRYWQWYGEKVSVMEYHKQMIDIYVGMANATQIKEILRSADSYTSMHNHHIIRGMYFDMLGCYYDTLLGGAYYPENDEEADLLEKLIDSEEKAISEMEQEPDKRKIKYLTRYYLSLASILIRSVPDYYDEAAELLDKVSELIEENSDNHCYYDMVAAWYYTLAQPDTRKTRALTEQAEESARQVFPTDLEIIDIIHIPTANCFYYHDDFPSAADKIEEAVEICRKYPDTIPYIDKQAELLNILLDIYLAIEDKAKCRQLIAEIDHINETYKEQGICREVSPEIRKQIL
ncbi:MAG: serine/threonine protein kinase [Ruminococcus sp.]|nr:serine/threonine protein kinase [Ruminococcus sp.]